MYAKKLRDSLESAKCCLSRSARGAVDAKSIDFCEKVADHVRTDNSEMRRPISRFCVK
jgi:hypothetical protein